MILEHEKQTLISIFDKIPIVEVPEALTILKKRQKQRIRLMNQKKPEKSKKDQKKQRP